MKYHFLIVLLLYSFHQDNCNTCFQETPKYSFPQILGSTLANTQFLCIDLSFDKSKLVVGGFSQASDITLQNQQAIIQTFSFNTGNLLWSQNFIYDGTSEVHPTQIAACRFSSDDFYIVMASQQPQFSILIVDSSNGSILKSMYEYNLPTSSIKPGRQIIDIVMFSTQHIFVCLSLQSQTFVVRLDINSNTPVYYKCYGSTTNPLLINYIQYYSNEDAFYMGGKYKGKLMVMSIAYTNGVVSKYFLTDFLPSSTSQTIGSVSATNIIYVGTAIFACAQDLGGSSNTMAYLKFKNTLEFAQYWTPSIRTQCGSLFTDNMANSYLTTIEQGNKVQLFFLNPVSLMSFTQKQIRFSSVDSTFNVMASKVASSTQYVFCGYLTQIDNTVYSKQSAFVMIQPISSFLTATSSTLTTQYETTPVYINFSVLASTNPLEMSIIQSEFRAISGNTQKAISNQKQVLLPTNFYNYPTILSITPATVTTQTYTIAQSTLVYHVNDFSYQDTTCTDLIWTYTATLTTGAPLPTFITFTQLIAGSGSQFSIFTNDINNVGTYSVRLRGYVPTNQSNYADFNVVISFTPGTITFFQINAIDSQEVQTMTSFNIQIQPQHLIPSTSQLEILFPITLTFADSSCTFNLTFGGFNSVGSCTIQSNKLIIPNPFGIYSYDPSLESYFSLTFSTQGMNPTSTKDAGNFHIRIISLPSEQLIDELIISNIYSALPGTLTLSSVVPNNYVTFTGPSEYSFTIMPNKVIPQYSKIYIILPPDISIFGANLSGCSIIKSSTTYTLSGYSIVSTNPIKIQIDDAFNDSSYIYSQTSFIIVLTGLLNPRSLAPSSSFQIKITDQNNYDITQKLTDIQVSMIIPKEMMGLTLTPSSLINGQINNYLLDFIASSPLVDLDYMQITFPSEIILTGSETCTINSNVNSLSCTILENTITAIFTFPMQLISVGESFSIFINNIVNPPNTEPCRLSNIGIYDQNGYQINQYSDSTVNIQTNTPTPITTFSLTQESYIVSTPNLYTITYTNQNAMKANSAFIITYPSSVTVESPLSTVQIIYNSINYPMLHSISGNSILITSGLSVYIPKGSQIQIRISMIANPTIQVADYGSFTLTSFTDNSFTYYIDQVLEGLNPQLFCSYPCKTCSTATSCDSCHSSNPSVAEKYFIYDLNQCVTTCPVGFYPDIVNFVCLNCQATCGTCSNEYTCDSCDPGGIYPYLIENQCYQSCLPSYYGSGGQCYSCNSQCLTCAGSEIECTSCDPNSGYPYLSGQRCVSSCPDGTFLENYVCQSCDQNCLTCFEAATFCTSCPPLFPYQQDSICVSSCQDGYFISGNKCLPCNENCQTCITSATNCLSCNAIGYTILYENQCLTSCPKGTYSSMDTCYPCTGNCQTCNLSASSCDSCDIQSSFSLIYLDQCVSECPIGTYREQFSCKPCDPNCLTCANSATRCSSCDSNKYFYIDQCYQKCQKQTLLINGVCVQCREGCSSCINTIDECTSCLPIYSLFNNKCILKFNAFEQVDEQLIDLDLKVDILVVIEISKLVKIDFTVQNFFIEMVPKTDSLPDFIQQQGNYILMNPQQDDINQYKLKIKVGMKESPFLNSTYSLKLTVEEDITNIQIKETNNNIIDKQENQQSISAKIEKITFQGVAIVKFSEYMIKPQNISLIDTKDLNITIIDQPITLINSWKVSSFSENKMTIDLEFTEPLNISQSGECDQLKIVFISNKQFKPQSKLNPIPNNYYIKNYIPPQDPNQDNKFLTSFTSILKNTVQTIIYGNVATSFLFQQSLCFLWGTINTLQVVVHFPLLNFSFPSNVLQLMQTFVEIMTFDIFKSDSFHQKFYHLSSSDLYTQNNYRLYSMEYSSTNIIYNMGSTLIILELIIVFTLISLFLKLIPLKFVKIIRRKLLGGLFFSIPIRFFIEISLEGFISAIINLKDPQFTQTGSIISFVFAIVLICIIIGGPIVLAILIQKYKSEEQIYTLKERVGSIYTELKAKDLIGSLYFFEFVLFRLLFSLVVVLLMTKCSNYP